MISWGLDVATCYNIVFMLPANLDFQVKYSFIMNALERSIIQQNENGWDITAALKHIIRSYEDFSQVDRELAEIVLSGLENKPHLQDKHFRIY